MARFHIGMAGLVAIGLGSLARDTIGGFADWLLVIGFVACCLALAQHMMVKMLTEKRAVNYKEDEKKAPLDDQ
jgi:hypothetical protein